MGLDYTVVRFSVRSILIKHCSGSRIDVTEYMDGTHMYYVDVDDPRL